MATTHVLGAAEFEGHRMLKIGLQHGHNLDEINADTCQLDQFDVC